MMAKKQLAGAYVHSNNSMLRISEFDLFLRLPENTTKTYSAIFYPVFSENQTKQGMIFLMAAKERDIEVYARGHHALKSFADEHALKSGNKAGTAAKLTVAFGHQKKAVEIYNTEPHRKMGKWDQLIDILRPELCVVFDSWYVRCYENDYHYFNTSVKPEFVAKM